MRSRIVLSSVMLGACFMPAFSQSNLSYEIFSNPTRFGISSSQSVGATVTGDFNGDGKADLIFTGSTSNYLPTLMFAAGNGDGTFQPATTFYTASASAPNGGNNVNEFETPILVADLNNDGHLDLVTSGGYTSNGQYQVMYGNGDGTFSSPFVPAGQLENPFSVALGDFDGDGKLDMAIGYGAYSGNAGGTIQIFTNSGQVFVLTKTITNAAIDLVWSLGAGDIDQDGKADLIVGATHNLVALWGQGGNNFTPATLHTYSGPQQGSVNVSLADVNQDGSPDIMTTYSCSTQGSGAGRGASTNTCSAVDVFYGGQGKQKTFYRSAITDNTVNVFGGIAAVDVNGDGISDIVGTGLVVGSQAGALVYLGNPDGSFNPTYQRFIINSEGASNVLLADFNRDGKMDLFSTGSMFLNATPTAACAASAISPTVTVCQPVEGTTIPTTALAVNAKAYDTTPVTDIQVYVDNNLLYNEAASSLNRPISETPGEHFIVTKAWDAKGVSFRSNRHVLVYNGTPGATCSAPPVASSVGGGGGAISPAAICLPNDNTGNTTHIVANGDTPVIPTAAQLYVDGSLVSNDIYPTSAVDVRLPLSSGTHSIVFKLWDANGNIATASTTVTKN